MGWKKGVVIVAAIAAVLSGARFSSWAVPDATGSGLIVIGRETIGSPFNRQEVRLYYEGDIKLDAGGRQATVLPEVPADWIGSDDPFNQLINELHVREDRQRGVSYLVVGSTYSFTNKYGTMSWLKGYAYDGSSIREILNTDDVLRSPIVVKDYDGQKLTLEIDNWERDLIIHLESDEIERIEQYISFYKNEWDGGPWEFIGKDDYLFFAVMPDYAWADMDGDGVQELTANFYMHGGAAGITDLVHFVYRFGESGMELADVVSGRDAKFH